MDSPDPELVQSWLANWQESVIAQLRAVDPAAQFGADAWERAEGGGGVSRACAGGDLLEKAGVNFSDVRGAALPPAATTTRPDLAGRPFRAMGVSIVVHPRHPYCPTAHANIRFFCVTRADGTLAWWFGGGFDLTPYYGFVEDAVAWHRAARQACAPFGEHLYPRFKEACDRYFFLPHRGELRGVGGLFFDDFDEGGFGPAFALGRSIGESFAPAYTAILRRRRDLPYGERERQFQLYRRGRYVEFNLLYDRGTLFGLQSGGRVESILMSLPPLARWEYNWQCEPGTPESRLLKFYLQPHDWLNEAPEEAP
jgi:coproporphyrinogen III oxidase